MWIVFEIIWFIIFALLLGGDKSGQRSGLANFVIFGILAALCLALVAFFVWVITGSASV